MSGAKVEVYKASGNSAGSLVKSATTSSSGAYKVSGLDDGTYLVLFANGSASYFADWYTSAPLYREVDATKVTVNGAETGKNGNLQPIFSDIAGNTFYGDILWLRNTGITLGCDDFHFCPSSSVTRGQMAAFLVRGLDLTGDTSGDTFQRRQRLDLRGRDRDPGAGRCHPRVRRRPVLPRRFGDPGSDGRLPGAGHGL